MGMTKYEIETERREIRELLCQRLRYQPIVKINVMGPSLNLRHSPSADQAPEAQSRASGRIDSVYCPRILQQQ